MGRSNTRLPFALYYLRIFSQYNLTIVNILQKWSLAGELEQRDSIKRESQNQHESFFHFYLICGALSYRISTNSHFLAVVNRNFFRGRNVQD